MPNRPDDPYARFPLTAAAGLVLMLAGAVALLMLSPVGQAWLREIASAVVLAALIGTAAVALRRRKVRPRARETAKGDPLRQPPEPAPFDPAGFVEAVRQIHQAPRSRQIEEGRAGEAANVARSHKADPSQTIRRLQDLRDHPATPEPERQAAGEKVKKLRSKRRSAWSKRP